MAGRFRGFLPVVIDVETGGFDSRHDALLEIGATLLSFDADGQLVPETTIEFGVDPFPGANLEPSALEFTGIDPTDPSRDALPEYEVLMQLFQLIRSAVRAQDCKRAILVGHNAGFDHGFLFAATRRVGNKRNPFHPFSTFDTVPLAALAYGQTVLSTACQAAGIAFEKDSAHRAAYDSLKTAELFCCVVNRWQQMGGWPAAVLDPQSLL